MIVQKRREYPIGVGGEVVTLYQKYATPNPNNGRPRGFPTPSERVELYSASFAKAGYAPLSELGVCGSTELRNEIIYNDLKFSFMHDTAPVASMMLAMNVLVVHPASSVRSVPELIAAAKANPDAMTVASAGVGSTSHVFWELFRSMTGTRMLHVPYRGGAPALTDLLAQQVQVYFATPADTMEYIKAGRLRALAVTGATRAQALPDVPTIGEFVPGYEAVGWLGIVAPKDTSAAIIDMLNNVINAGLADPKIKQTIANWGETVFASSPAEFGEFLAAENEKWGKVIRAANIKL